MIAAGDLLTVAQALAVLPIGRSTLYALVDSGQLPSYRVSPTDSRRARVLIARQDLEAFVAGARQVATRASTHVNVDEVLARVRRRGRGA